MRIHRQMGEATKAPFAGRRPRGGDERRAAGRPPSNNGGDAAADGPDDAHGAGERQAGARPSVVVWSMALLVGTTAAAWTALTVALQPQEPVAVAVLCTMPALASAVVIVYGLSAAQVVEAPGARVVATQVDRPGLGVGDRDGVQGDQAGVGQGEGPHQEGREEHRLVLHRRQLEAGHDSAAVTGRPHQVLSVELRLAEERVRAGVGERDQLTQDDSGRGRREPAEVLQIALALVGGEVLHDGPQVLQVQQRQAGRVGEVEDQPEAGFLDGVQPEHLGQQDRTERRDRRAHRRTDSCATEGEELHGVRRGHPGLADLGGPLRRPVTRLSRRGQPGQVALDVGQEDRDPGRRELLGHQLKGLGLACPGRAGYQAVPVERRQGDPDQGVGMSGAIDDRGAELQGGSGEGIARRDRVELGGGVRRRAWCHARQRIAAVALDCRT